MKDIGLTTLLNIFMQKSVVAKHTKVTSFFSKDGAAYDFYKELKYAAKGYARGAISLEEVLLKLETVKNKTEKTHNQIMVKAFAKWWGNQKNISEVKEPPSKKVIEISGVAFPIRLAPELRYVQNGQDKIVYLWANANRMEKLISAEGLMLLRKGFSGAAYADVKFYFLDVKTGKVYGEEGITNRTAALLDANLSMVSTLWLGAQNT